MITKPETPELDKMLAVKEKSQIIGDFLEHLQEGEVYLAQMEDDDDGAQVLRETNFTTEQILANYFGINLDKAEQERGDLLDWVRDSQE